MSYRNWENQPGIAKSVKRLAQPEAQGQPQEKHEKKPVRFDLCLRKKDHKFKIICKQSKFHLCTEHMIVSCPTSMNKINQTDDHTSDEASKIIFLSST